MPAHWGAPAEWDRRASGVRMRQPLLKLPECWRSTSVAAVGLLADAGCATSDRQRHRRQCSTRVPSAALVALMVALMGRAASQQPPYAPLELASLPVSAFAALVELVPSLSTSGHYALTSEVRATPWQQHNLAHLRTPPSSGCKGRWPSVIVRRFAEKHLSLLHATSGRHTSMGHQSACR